MSAPLHIILTGPESTGKSTLAKALAGRLNAPVVEEYLRDYFAERGQLTLEDAIPIAQGQWSTERQAALTLPPNQDILVCDTDLVSSLVYNAHYYAAERDSTTWQKWENWAVAHLDALKSFEHGPRLYLLCGIDWPWEEDAQRDAPHLRDTFHEAFKACLRRHDLDMRELTGSLDERLAQALAHISKFEATKARS